MNKQLIENKVDQLFVDIGYKLTDDKIDVIKIAKELGFAVGNALLDEDDDGFIIVQDGAKKILGIETDKLIGVNSNRTMEWKRFIIAHEIAHYILNYSTDKTKGIYAHREHKKGKNNSENEADFFAANLLMPREKFEEKYNELVGKKLQQEDVAILLAKKFQVTQRMAERRIEELNLHVA